MTDYYELLNISFHYKRSVIDFAVNSNEIVEKWDKEYSVHKVALDAPKMIGELDRFHGLFKRSVDDLTINQQSSWARYVYLLTKFRLLPDNEDYGLAYVIRYTGRSPKYPSGTILGHKGYLDTQTLTEEKLLEICHKAEIQYQQKNN